MDKAVIAASNTDVMFQCPKCEEVFVYDNDILPTEIPTYHTCEKCNTPLFIAPLSIHVQFKKPKSTISKTRYRKKVNAQPNETVDISYDLYKSAKKIVMSYGFSAKEVDNAMSSIQTTGLELTEVIKQTLSNIGNNDT